LVNQHLSAELNLLKSQVQPHFLFNTLNNIYSLAYIKSEKTAEVVAKLSDMMRYFVEHAPKEKVPLAQEIEFLQNYISLESIRMLHPLQLEFGVQVPNEDMPIPPMLFTPFVENVFKHGVDKKSKDNLLQICMLQRETALHFSIKNRLFPNQQKATGGGTGLDNIRKRLTILYGTRYELTISNDGEFYLVKLTLPIQADDALPTH
jgi:sensor histidine kinase YesM